MFISHYSGAVSVLWESCPCTIKIIVVILQPFLAIPETNIA